MKPNIIINICLLIPYLAIGQDQLLKFKNFTIEDGLSQSSIMCILKDSRGYMWFGTEDGLNKYDGNNFTVYRHKPNDKESISDSNINSIVEQEDGFLWIGTKNGLNYFNPDNEKFIRYHHNPNDTSSISHDEINSLQITKDKHLLIGTSNGLNKFEGKTKFLRYNPKGTKLPYYIESMAQDKEGYLWLLTNELIEKIRLEDSFSEVIIQKPFKNSLKNSLLLDSLNLWIGTGKGLIKFNLLTQELVTFKLDAFNKYKNKTIDVLSIINGETGKLWLGTIGGGLINFDKSTNTFKTVLQDINDHSNLHSNGIKSLFLDESNILWLGTFGTGIKKHDPNQFLFKHYRYTTNGENSFRENTVRSILKDRDGELWVGTQGGLKRINRKNGSIKAYKYNQNKPSTISSNTVRALKEDSNGIIWAGTWNNGLNSFDKKSGKFKRYISLPGRTDSIGPVRAIEIDSQDNIWLGGSGLIRFNPKTNKYKRYFYFEKNNGSRYYAIHNLYFDKTGLLWIGTKQNGLISMDTHSNIIKKYSHNPEDTLSISHNYVTSISKDDKGFIWVGTYGGGLNKLDVSTGVFQHYNTSNGLLNDVVYGVLIDNQDYIWFTSNEGLTRFDPNKKDFKHFGVDQGIQSEEFNAGAYFKDRAGEFFFGGINGFNAFYPNTINKNSKASDIVFTDFQLPDKLRLYSTNELFGKNISRLEHIKLNYDQNNFSLKFSELNYANTVDNKYEYQLNGLNNDWHDLGKKRLITIGNLKPGKYVLNVRVHNELAKKASLGLTILPPYWKTYWAYLFYLIIVLSFISLLYRSTRKNLNLRKQFEFKIKNLESNINASSQEQNRNGINNLTIKSTNELSIDEKFLQRAIEIVENNLSDSSFDVERFANELFISKSQLYRKLKRITGYSVTGFIRLIRLKRAAQLLNINTATVTEIAYKVGFDNVGYFSKCFKEIFGKPPSKYSK